MARLDVPRKRLDWIKAGGDCALAAEALRVLKGFDNLDQVQTKFAGKPTWPFVANCFGQFGRPAIKIYRFPRYRYSGGFARKRILFPEVPLLSCSNRER